MGECLIFESLKDLIKEMPERHRFVLKENKKKIKEIKEKKIEGRPSIRRGMNRKGFEIPNRNATGIERSLPPSTRNE